MNYKINRVRVVFIIFATVFLILPHRLFAAALAKESALELANAYKMEGVGSAVSGLVGEAVGKEISGKMKAWMIEAVEDVDNELKKQGTDTKPAGMSERDYKKEEIKKRLKEKIKKHLPEIAKKVLYEKLFLGQFGDQVKEVEAIVEKVMAELKVTFNERVDQIVSDWYDKAIDQVKEYLHYKAGPIEIDLTDVRGTLDAAINMNTVEWGFTKALSQSLGESTVNGIKDRMRDIISGELPPEAMQYLNYAPEKFAEYASKVEENLPGKKLDEIKEKILHTPLFILPGGVYGGILAGSAARHFAEAIKGPVVDPNEIRRGIEVTRVMIWQLNEKDGLSVDLASFLEAVSALSNFGLSLDNLGKVGDMVKDVKGKLAELDAKIKELDSQIMDKVNLAGDKIKEGVGAIEGKLKEIQDTLFKPLKEGYVQADRLVKEANSAVLGAIPENISGIPPNWDAFKKQFGIKKGILGKMGDKSPWDIIHDFAEKSGFIDAYEKIKADMKKAGDKVNDAISGALADAATEIVDEFGFTDQLSRALGINYVPSENPSVENPLDPVLLHNGEFYHQSIDLTIPGRGLNYRFFRTYRSKANFKGVMGHNWSHNYEERLVLKESDAIYIDANGKKYVFKLRACHPREKSYFQSVVIASVSEAIQCKHLNLLDRHVALRAPRDDNVLLYESPTGIFSILYKIEDGYVLRDADGLKTYFGKTGLLAVKEDRLGNRLFFEHDKFGRLTKVTDTFNRPITYSYNSAGLLDAVADFTGRSIGFSYDDNSDLVAATSPLSFDFPKGKTTRYSYTTGYYEKEELNHNLILIMDPKGQIYLKNKYGESGFAADRVVSQQYGANGSRMLVSYELFKPAYLARFAGDKANEPVDRVVISDRRGIVHYYQHNANGNLLTSSLVDETGRTKLMSKYGYNDDGLKVEATEENGVTVRSYYEDKNSRLSAENVTKSVILSRDGRSKMETKYSYEPLYNQPEKIVLPSGETRIFDFDDRGLVLGMKVTGKDGSVKIFNYTYNDFGQLDTVSDVLGPIASYKYYSPDGSDISGGGYLASVMDGEGGTRAYKYDRAGNITEATDPLGNTTHYMINSLDQVMSEISPSPFNYKKEFVYDGDNNVAEIIIRAQGGIDDADVGEEIRHRFTYDDLDNLIERDEQVTKVERIVRKWVYDPEGRVTREIKPKGNDVQYIYDAAGHRVKIIKGGDGCHREEANGRRGDPANSNCGSQTIAIEHNEFGEPVKYVNGAGRETNFVRDGFGRVTKEIDPLGVTREVKYDDGGNAVKVTVRDRSKEMLSETDHTYDGLGRLIEKKMLVTEKGSDDERWLRERYTYNERDEMVGMLDTKGRQWKYRYNGDGKLVQVLSPNGKEFVYSYDLKGQLISSSPHLPAEALAKAGLGEGGGEEELKAKTEYQYDPLGRVISMTGPGNDTTRYSYDSRNNLVSTQDPRGFNTYFLYDGLSRRRELRREVEKGVNVATKFKWDANSRLKELVDENKNTTKYEYDPLDRLISETDANGAVRRYKYDNTDDLTAIYEKNGSVINNTYDAVGNLVERRIEEAEVTGGTTWQWFAYDGMGRLIASKDNNDPSDLDDDAEVYYRYDLIGRKIGEMQDGKWVLTRFGADDEPLITKYPSGKVIYKEYNNADELARIFADGKNIASYTYDGLGLPTREQLGNGLAENYRYDPAGRLLGQNIAKADGAAPLEETGYSYGAGDLLVSRKRGGAPEEKFAYDGLGRLTAADGREKDRWKIDPVGNWLTHDENGKVKDFKHDELNRLLEAGGEKYAYDKNGNLASDGKFKYIYDGLNRLSQVIKLDGTNVARYTYDVHNRRTAKVINGPVAQCGRPPCHSREGGNPELEKTSNIMKYIYDNWNIAEEYKGGILAKSFIYGDDIDTPVAMSDNKGNDYYYHRDHLGSVTALSDNFGALVEKYAYTPYGTPSPLKYFSHLLSSPLRGEESKEGVDLRGEGQGEGEGEKGQPYTYSARQYDPETGLYYYRNRYYSPETGRFITPDPMGYKNDFYTSASLYEGAKADTNVPETSLYAFVGNDPMNWTDPLGLRRITFLLQREEEVLARERDGIRGLQFQREAERYVTLGTMYMQVGANGVDVDDGSASKNWKRVAYTLEPPWLGNKKWDNIEAHVASRIPAGQYSVAYDEKVVIHEKKNGLIRMLLLNNVENRKGVRIHNGNYPRQTKGCILVGRTKNVNAGTVLSSVDAMRDLRKAIDNVSNEDKANNDTTEIMLQVMDSFPVGGLEI